MRKVAVIFLLFTLHIPSHSYGADNSWTLDEQMQHIKHAGNIWRSLDKGIPLEEVLGMFDKEAEKYPDHKEAMCFYLANKAFVYSRNTRRKPDFEKALQVFEELPVFCRDHFYMHRAKGLVLEKKGDIEAALEAYKQGAGQVKDKGSVETLLSDANFLFAESYTFSPEELWELFTKEEQPKKKRVTMKGEIYSIEALPSAPDRKRVLLFVAKDHPPAMVACLFDPPEISELRSGQTVTIQGTFGEMDAAQGFLFLYHCILRK